MISRLTTVATSVAVVTAFLLAFNGTSSTPAQVASATPSKQVRAIELEPVVVTGKRLQPNAPI